MVTYINHPALWQAAETKEPLFIFGGQKALSVQDGSAFPVTTRKGSNRGTDPSIFSVYSDIPKQCQPVYPGTILLVKVYVV